MMFKKHDKFANIKWKGVISEKNNVFPLVCSEYLSSWTGLGRSGHVQSQSFDQISHDPGLSGRTHKGINRRMFSGCVIPLRNHRKACMFWIFLFLLLGICFRSLVLPLDLLLFFRLLCLTGRF